MKTIKGLVLGSAASFLALSGAQAADLPVKAKAVEYVKVCSLYGAGFFYIPGTDTCIKLGGYVQVSTVLGTNSVYTGNVSGSAGARNRLMNMYTTRSRGDLNIDTRTATEYGVVRTYFDAVFTWASGNYLGSGTTTYGQNGQATNPGGSDAGAVAGGSLGVYHAFIQFAGFTMGRTLSQFNTPWNNYPGNLFDGLVGGSSTVTGVNQFTYTAQMGNGVSLILSAQDPTQYFQAGMNNLAVAPAAATNFGYGSNNLAGAAVPDLVAALQVEQAWGAFKLSFAAHNNRAGFYTAAGEPSGHPDDKWGFAVQAGLNIKNIPTGKGDDINIQGVYTNGATRYNIQELGAAHGAAVVYGPTSLAGAYNSVGIGFAPDAVFGLNGQQELVTTWGMRGGFNHNWDPYWSSSLYGAYAAVRYNDNAKTLLCGVGGVGGTVRAALGNNLSTCNPDYNIAQIGFITRWTPVKNLAFSVDYTWTGIDQSYAGTTTAAAIANPTVGKPATTYEFRDQNTHQMLLRAQRNW